MGPGVGSRRRAAVVVAAILLGFGTSACGGDPSPYCQAIEKDRSTLDGFGAQRTEKAFTRYSRMLTSISKVAPKPIDEQWASLGRATQGVLTAHDTVGFALQDMDDEDKTSTLSAGDVDVLNKAYTRFNRTTAQREAVVADVSKTCDITLK